MSFEPVLPKSTYVLRIAAELKILPRQVESIGVLLAEGSTVPFIARYRKEVTGSLDEVAITSIRDRLIQLYELDKRRATILESIHLQGKLTQELKERIENVETLAVLEDLYLPFKPKRRTRATAAKEKGLEPLARKIFDSVGKYKTFLTAKNSFPTQADFPLKNLDEVGTAMASSIDLGKAMQQRRYDDRREEFSCHLPFQSGRLKINLAAAAVLLFACLLGFLTFQRNQVYVSEEALWQDVIAKRPLNPRGHYGLGNVYFGRGEYDEAIRHYKEALRIKPDYVKPLNDLGLALFQQGQWAEAEAYFREAVRVMPDFPGTYNNLGLLYTRKGKFKEARDFFEEAIKISPSYAEAYNHLGIVLMNMGKTDEAVKSYEKALAIKPYYAEARNNLGNVLAQRGQWRQAIVYYRRALQDNPDFAGAYNNLGTAFAGLEEWPEAIAAYETALKIQPDFSEAKSNLKMAKGRQAASR